MSELRTEGLLVDASEEPHYCQPEQDCELIDHPLNDISEIGIDPLMAYGVFRCGVCGHFWGQYLYKKIWREQTDWMRFGSSLAAVYRHC